MDLKEFERQVLVGEITDFEPYFEQAENEDDIYIMQQICIKNNVCQEKYRNWAENFVLTDDADMQFLLIEKDHCLDILICSENKEVRQEVIEHNIKYAFEDHIMEYDQDIIIEILMSQIEPPAKLLDFFLECNDGSWDLSALKLKQKAQTMTPTTIEKTMSLLQLFEANNPLWTTVFTGYQVYNIIQAPSPKDAIPMQKKLNKRK